MWPWLYGAILVMFFARLSDSTARDSYAVCSESSVP